MPLSFKRNNSLSIISIEVIGISINCKNLSILDVLNELNIFQKDHIIIKHPINLEKINKIDSSIINKVYYIESNKKLNQLFHNAKLIEKIYYIDIIGITINIDRHISFRDAIIYHKFCDTLKVRGIINPSLIINENGNFIEKIRRIHVIQPDFLDDPEIITGLQITYLKNTNNNKVLYVCSEELLSIALKFCLPNITLIIDGHWEHKKNNNHGCWENVDCYMIANSLQRLYLEYPEKISYIRLWGCESGKIAEFNKLSKDFNPKNLIFKDDCLLNFNEKEMAMFRNRAIYYTLNEEIPYDIDSLAAQIMKHLPNLKRISATPSFGYPYPVQEIPIYNIGSDTMAWRDQHYWISNDELFDTLGYSSWYKKLHKLKSITVIRDIISNNNIDQWPSKNYS